ncbi:MAG TPA: thiamine pyrophosphate-binding protein [Candidatus Desulfaltia sp.]|nr:thiamine pyrophosphate-binding protein [Candidatus Desulfaltia sp.]
MKLAGSDLLVKLLEANEVKYIFGVPGGHLLKFYDSLRDSDKITPILTKHEAGASFMATGYAQVSRKLGVCVGTVGPGATNLVTGVASAYMDSTPVLVLTAQVGTSAIGKGGLQEATGQGRTPNHVEIFDGITKYSTLVARRGWLPQAFRNAMVRALNGRPGPVHLDITADTFSAVLEIDESQIKPSKRIPMAGRLEDVKQAAALLLDSKNPAILVGAGAIEAAEEIRELIETYKIPVATTLRAKGIVPESHELSVGCVGLYGTNVANKFLRTGIDVLLAIGTSFSEFTTHAWDPKFQPETALIQVDVDEWEIGKNYNVTLGILGDSKIFMKQLLGEMRNIGVKQLGKTEDLKREKSSRDYYSDPKMASDTLPLKPQRLMKELRKALPDDTIVFGDIGNNLAWIESFFQVNVPRTYYISSSMASMGYGVAAAIGGQLAAPNRDIVCVCGDGGFQMQGMEVVTAVNYGLPVKWFIMNNGMLGMIKDTQDVLFNGRRISTDFVNPDFVRLAEAMGAVGLRITKPSEIGLVVEEALSNDKPTVVDIVIDPEEAPSFDARAEAMVRAWGVEASLFQKMKMIPELLRRR